MQEPMRVIALSALVLPLEIRRAGRAPASSSILRRIREVLEDPCGDAWQKPQEVVSALARLRTKYVKLTVNVHGADVWCASFNQRNANVSSELKKLIRILTRCSDFLASAIRLLFSCRHLGRDPPHAVREIRAKSCFNLLSVCARVLAR